MKSIKISLVLVFPVCCLIMLSGGIAKANNVFSTSDSTTVLLDDILFEAKTTSFDHSANTATVSLTLLNQKSTPRELRINVYGIQLLDNLKNSYYFSSLTLGRVLIRFEDKQNYAHYLLQPDEPVMVQLSATGISPDAAAIHLVKFVFEDSTEEGRFIDAVLIAPEVKE